ncbi:hypothetical protein GCM10020331_098420 [Ectobacillus funiculus]
MSFSNLLKEAQESIRKEIKYEYEQHMKETLSHITAQMQQELRKQLPEPKSSEQIRAERIERTIATTRIRAKLEQEALELWEQKNLILSVKYVQAYLARVKMW